MVYAPKVSPFDTHMNQKLGLPFANDGRIQKVAICFDVDGTLVKQTGEERESLTQMLMLMRMALKQVKIFVWSGGGKQYAEKTVERLGLSDYVSGCLSKWDYKKLREEGYFILAIDDIHDTRLGDINLIVKN